METPRSRAVADGPPAPQQELQLTRSLFQELGLNVEFMAMDWGSLVSRGANSSPPEKGGWNAFCTLWDGLTVSNPGSSYPLRANGKRGWLGWPTDEKLEALRQQWFDAPNLASQQALCQQIQRRAFEVVPFIPLGEVFQSTAFRSNITDVVKAAIPLFWGDPSATGASRWDENVPPGHCYAQCGGYAKVVLD
jgi:peptide/nickel transport system substrate-binding protein